MRMFSVLPVLVLLGAPALGQVTQVGPFSGEHDEGFEPPAFSDSGIIRVLDNTADLATPWGSGVMIVDGFDVPLGPTCLNYTAHGGMYAAFTLAGFVPGDVTYTSDQPLDRFGGYFLLNAPGHSVLAYFFDANDQQVGADVVPVPVDCTNWTWVGWDFGSLAVQRVHLASSDAFGGHLIMDDIEVDASGTHLGTQYCNATVNSTGVPAEIFAVGPTAASEFEIFATHLPASTPAIFYYGDAQVNALPFGEGVRCVGGTTFRLLPPQFSGPEGTLQRVVDLTSPPQPAGQIIPGSTWNFQAWFRDPAGGPIGFNTSNGLEILFTF